MIGMFFSFDGVSTFVGYLISKLFLSKITVLLFNPELRKLGFHTRTNGISPRVNIIARVEFELTFYEVIIHHICHYINGIFFAHSCSVYTINFGLVYMAYQPL